MKLTVKQLKEKIKDLDDDVEVFMERVEDVYFDKHGWKTESITFSVELNEYSDVFNAAQCTIFDNKLVILAHY